MVGHANDDALAMAKAREQGRSEAMMQVKDTPMAMELSMPLWLQDDPQWATRTYSDGTIETYGCGLTCAAMAITYETGLQVTPGLLCSLVGDDCLTDRVNDMTKFSQWIEDHYSNAYRIETSVTFWSLDEALALVDDGWLVFGGIVGGSLGEKDYSNHVVLIWRGDGQGNYWVRDPDSGANSQRSYTRDDLTMATWGALNATRSS